MDKTPKPGLRRLGVRVRVRVNVAGVTTEAGSCRAEQMGNWPITRYDSLTSIGS